MSEQVTVDLFTEDTKTNEFALYIIEDGPWPDSEEGWDACLFRIQNQVLGAFDAVVDGGVAKKFPESVGAKFRIQVDSPSGLPDKLDDLIAKIESFVHQPDNEYGQGIANSEFISGLRVVTGHSLGRWPQPNNR